MLLIGRAHIRLAFSLTDSSFSSFPLFLLLIFFRRHHVDAYTFDPPWPLFPPSLHRGREFSPLFPFDLARPIPHLSLLDARFFPFTANVPKVSSFPCCP